MSTMSSVNSIDTFLIDIVSSGASTPEETNQMIKFLLPDIMEISAETLYIILTLVGSITECTNSDNFKTFMLLYHKLRSADVQSFNNILWCFREEASKFKIFELLIKKYTLNTEIIEIFSHFDIYRPKVYQRLSGLGLKSDISDFLDIFKKTADDEKLRLLEESVLSKNLNLDNIELWCQELKESFNNKEEYLKSCEILGINPEVFIQYL